MNQIIVDQKLNLNRVHIAILDNIKGYPKNSYDVKLLLDEFSIQIIADSFTSYFLNHYINTIPGINYLFSVIDAPKGRIIMKISLQ